MQAIREFLSLALYFLPVSALSLICLWLLHRGRIPWAWTRFAPGAPPPEPRWDVAEVALGLVFYLLAQVLVARQVLALEDAGALGPASGALITLALSNGAACLFLVLVVGRRQERALAALGCVRSPIRNAAPVLLVYAFGITPVVFLHASFRTVVQLLSGEPPPDQQPVEMFRELAADGAAVELVLLAVGAAVVAPICEEIVFRGFFFGQLRTRWGFGTAAALSSAVFALLHGTAAVAIFCVGLLLCYVYERTGSLYWAMVFHGVFNGVELAGLFFTAAA